MRKLAMVLAILMLLSILVGCGKQEENENVSPETPTESIPREDEYLGHAPDEEHSFEMEVLSDPDCVNPGQIMYMCLCGEGYIDEIAPLGHEVIPATCEQDGYCASCNAMVEPPLGHVVVDGICERCRAVVD